MKKTFFIIILTAAALASCTSSETAASIDRHEISWRAFCDERGYDRGETSAAAINEYLDAWRGSANEEAALLKAGVGPF